MAYWVYKCNNRRHPHQVLYGDWEEVFLHPEPCSWGSTEWVPELASAQKDDIVLAYQTDFYPATAGACGRRLTN